jgi:hypothetical protein
MDTAGGKTAHGTVVVQGACTGSNSQYWLPNYVNAQNERNIVASFDTSKCLDTEYGKKNATVPVVIGQCTGSSTQKWLPIQVTDPTRFNKVNRVGVHNAYDKATASSLIDLLNTSPGMIEIDLHGRGGGKWDVFHGSPGEGNNCSQGIHLEGCLSDIRKWHDQNPSHNPLVIKLEMKTDFVGKANTEAQLNAQLRKSLGVGNVFQPFDLMCKNRIVVGACTGGYYTSPQEAVDSGNWPTFTQMKGKILLYLVQSTGQLGVGAEVNWAHFTKNKWKTGNAGEFSVAFPGVLNVSNASTPDPRNDSKVLNQRAPKDWFVVFDGDAKGISNNTNVKTFLQSGKYLATGTDSQKLGNNGQGVDRRTASPDDILKIIDKNVKNGITFTSSDWFEPRQNALVGE